jgi:exodeoxyribonuclease V beta subunit
MNTNHRSTAEYIESMNDFFMPSANFDTFHFENDPVIPDAINYNNVGSPDPNKKGVLMYKGQPAKPIKISSHKSEKKLLQTVVLILKDLFTKDHYTIVKDEKSRPLQPSDLGILVRTKDEAKTLKSILTHLRIPAITIDDTRLLATNEATELFYILEAVNEISRSNINRALLSTIGGYSDTQLLTSDEETILLQFRTYQETWNNYGVYSMLKQFMADHDVYDRLFDNKVQNPERTISNVQQLIESAGKGFIKPKALLKAKKSIEDLKAGLEQ